MTSTGFARRSGDTASSPAPGVNVVGVAVLVGALGVGAMVTLLLRHWAPLALMAVVLSPPVAGQQPAPAAANSLAPYVPTPQDVVDRMLGLAGVTSKDVVYDLGCGDGRIVITAAKKFAARGMGVDIDPDRIKESEANAKAAGVEHLVTFKLQDAMTVDFSPASVVTLYLLPSLNEKLKPKLMKELKPGTRIVSHAFDMGDWKPEKELDVNGRKVYFWTIPKK